jgi:hypothetical protein
MAAEAFDCLVSGGNFSHSTVHAALISLIKEAARRLVQDLGGAPPGLGNSGIARSREIGTRLAGTHGADQALRGVGLAGPSHFGQATLKLSPRDSATHSFPALARGFSEAHTKYSNPTHLTNFAATTSTRKPRQHRQNAGT